MKELDKLLKIMSRLRDPDKGCPWDKEQTQNSLKEYILEEAYELVGAIDSGSVQNIKEELGDLLLQIVFIAQIYSEKKEFSFIDVVENLSKKMIERHPHIFGDTTVENSSEVKKNWEKIKQNTNSKKSILSDYPSEMPALLVSKRISEQAASIGFDWNSAEDALEKVYEELSELKAEVKSKNSNGIYEEIGDILLAVANVSRKLKVNPEMSLRKSNRKFSARFRKLEEYFREKIINPEKISIEEMNAIWEEIKKSEYKS